MADETTDTTDVADIESDLETLNKVDKEEQDTDLDLKEEDTEETEEESEKETEEKTEDEDESTKKLAGGRLTYKQITEKFPDLFKTFPALKHAFFHEQELSTLFPTVDDAKEAAGKAENFSILEADVAQGNPVTLLAAIGQMGEKSLEQFAGNLLPALHHVNREVFYQVTQPLIENVLRTAYNEGKSTGNRNLELAAQHLNRFMFGKSEIDSAETKTERKPDPERARFEQERAEFVGAKQREFEQGVHTTVRSSLTKSIETGLDTASELNEFVKSKLVESIIDEVGNRLEADPQHLSTMRSLWKRAATTGMTPEIKAKIANTYLARAKELMPSIRASLKAKAMGKKLTTNSKKEPTRIGGGQETKGADISKIDPKSIDWRKTSDTDFLAGKITFKK
jgi:hypothetical protein